MDKSKLPSAIFLVLVLGLVGFILYQRFSREQIQLPKADSPEASQVKHSIPLDEIYDGGPGKDGIPSIDDPKFISAAEARDEFRSNGLGLAISLNGEDRFYPYQILVWHELVNDNVGGTPILVSFCPLCGSGLVFDRRINGEAVEFGVSGKLHNSDLLMYDRKTDTLWAQILGEAVVGELTGTQLTQLEASVIEFKTFADKFPDGKVLSKDTGHNRNYESGPYGNYDNSEEIIFPVARQDDRLHPKTRILGVEVEGRFKAYPVESLREKKVITDSLNNHELRLEYNDGLVKVFDETNSKELVPVNTFWFGWFAFHPDTELFQK